VIEQSGYIPHPALKDLMLGEPLGAPWGIRCDWGDRNEAEVYTATAATRSIHGASSLWW